MIHVEKFYDVLKETGLSRIRVQDKKGNPLFSIDEPTSEQALIKLKEILPYFEQYQVVNITAAKFGNAVGNDFKNALKWEVCYSDFSRPAVTTGFNPTMPVQTSPVNQLREMMQLWGMFQSMSGANNNQIFEERMKLQQQHFELQLEKLKGEQDDPIKKYGFLAPFALSAMGKPNGEIKELMSLYNPGMSPGISGGNNLKTDANDDVKFYSHEEIAKFDDAEFEKHLAALMDSIPRKVKPEDFLMLMQIVNKKPELVPKAIGYFNQGLL